MILSRDWQSTAHGLNLPVAGFTWPMSDHKSVVGTHPGSFTCISLWLLSCCHSRVEQLQQKMYGLQRPKYLFSGPSQKTFAHPWSRWPEVQVLAPVPTSEVIWASYLTSLHLSCHICKLGTIIPTTGMSKKKKSMLGKCPAVFCTQKCSI